MSIYKYGWPCESNEKGAWGLSAFPLRYELTCVVIVQRILSVIVNNW